MISSGYNLPTGTVGAIGELRACSDLLAKGYEVFRSVSPSCSCDLAILKEAKLLRVEVRTGYTSLAGKSYTNRPKEMRADVLAVVYSDRVEYEPNL